MKFNKEILIQAVKDSNSFRDVGRKIGINSKTVKAKIIKYDIDYSHFHQCKAYQDILDKKFHMLAVKSISRIKDRNNKILYRANCLCDCGKEKSIDAAHVRYGKIGSCGCDKSRYEKTRGKNSSLYTGYEDISGKLWGTLKIGAKKRDLDFKISLKYAWDLFIKQDRKCSLTNLPICFGGTSRQPHLTSASLDRIDNDKGYLEGNVRWVLKDINMIRGSYDSDYFIKLCHAVADANPPEVKKIYSM